MNHGFALPERTDATPDTPIAKGMTRGFNELCTTARVQCTVTADLSVYRTVYQFKSFNPRPLLITIDGLSFEIEPGEELMIRAGVDNGYDISILDWLA